VTVAQATDPTLVDMIERTTRFVAIVTVALMLSSGNGTKQIPIFGATIDEEQHVHWALARYRDAGIPLPWVRFVFEVGSEPCAGSRGRYSGQTATITICARNRPGSEIRALLLHELGHARSFAVLDRDDRLAFVARNGKQTWNDPNAVWEDRGAELAADIVALGLATERDVARRIDRAACARLELEYRLLTDAQPSGVAIERCVTPEPAGAIDACACEDRTSRE
jgi:hypothetical protein